MSTTKLNTIDEYYQHLSTTVKGWLPEQRVIFAAAMSERWFPVYEVYSKQHQWGDPIRLKKGLDAVWEHIQGNSLSRSGIAHHSEQIQKNTPHMDDFDGEAALATCVMLSEALQCCATANNVEATLQAAISGFEAVAPEWEMDDDPPALWKKDVVRQEFLKQLKVVEDIRSFKNFDEATVNAFRQKLTSPDYVGEWDPVSQSETGFVTVTNQTAFEQYCGIVALDLKTRNFDWWEKEVPGSMTWAILLFSAWAGRYSRRLETVSGRVGQLADTRAQQALVLKQKAQDGMLIGTPNWAEEVHQVIDMALANSRDEIDVKTFDDPHGYGPSIRKMWLDAQEQGYTEVESWHQILLWAQHIPTAWAVEDDRKKLGLASIPVELAPIFSRALVWHVTSDLESPWETEVDGERWKIRLNDFPDDYMYSLLIEGKESGNFHDWPETWRRG